MRILSHFNAMIFLQHTALYSHSKLFSKNTRTRSNAKCHAAKIFIMLLYARLGSILVCKIQAYVE